jgi:NADPH:quinone reductase-like Zn-dependent oxidoreductase
VMAAGVGNWDELARAGGWDIGIQPPMALGVESAGIIMKVGEGVSRFAVGDAVVTHAAPLREQGFWAEWAIVADELLAPKPEGISWQDAAAFCVPALVAEQVLTEALQVQTGETLLVNGAGSTTGRLVVQLAVAKGLKVTATAGPSSAERVLGFGALCVLDYRNPDWPTRAREAQGGKGVNNAVNMVRGGASMAIQATADGGRLATITCDPPPPQRGVKVSDVYVHPDGRQLTELLERLGSGHLSLHVAAAYPIEAAAEALKTAASGRSGGAIALTVSPTATPTEHH